MAWHPYNPRKKRTRAHVLADLSSNHIEKIALECGFAVDRVWHDYGMDLGIFSFDKDGFLENGLIWVQAKATDRLLVSHQGTIPVRHDRRDVLSWIGEGFPVILMIYDAAADRAFWLWIQDHFAGPGAFTNLGSKTVTVSIPMANVLNKQAMREFARWKVDPLVQTGD